MSFLEVMWNDSKKLGYRVFLVLMASDSTRTGDEGTRDFLPWPRSIFKTWSNI